MDCGRTTGRDDYETPDAVFATAERMWGPFDLDAAASKANSRCARHYTPEDDGLEQPWFGRTWCNPPYGRDLKLWVAKAHTEVKARNAVLAVLLLPVRTDVAWFHDYLWQRSQIVFLRGRLTFRGEPAPAPFPSMLVCLKGSMVK